jgi:hypothetical protein
VVVDDSIPSESLALLRSRVAGPRANFDDVARVVAKANFGHLFFFDSDNACEIDVISILSEPPGLGSRFAGPPSSFLEVHPVNLSHLLHTTLG